MPDWEDLNKLKGVFNRFDTDRNEAIDRTEFGQLMDALGKDLSDPQLDEGFTQIDTDGSGEIEFSEFVDWWQARK